MSQDSTQTTRTTPEGNPIQKGAVTPTLKALVRENYNEFYDLSTLLRCLSLGISGLEVREIDASPLSCLAELCIDLAEVVADDREEMRQKWYAIQQAHKELLLHNGSKGEPS